MKQLYLLIFLFFFSIAAKANQDIVEGEYLIKLKPGIRTSQIQSLGITLGTYKNFPLLFHKKLSQKETDLFQTILSSDIEYIEPVYRVSAIGEMPTIEEIIIPISLDKQWGLENPRNTDVNAKEAWSYTTGSEDIVVAIIDTGIDYRHTDLASAMWVNKGEIPEIA